VKEESGWGPATLKTPRGRFVNVKAIRAYDIVVVQKLEERNRTRTTIGTRLPRKVGERSVAVGPSDVSRCAATVVVISGNLHRAVAAYRSAATQVCQLGESVQLLGRLVLGVKQRRLGPRAVKGVPAMKMQCSTPYARA